MSIHKTSKSGLFLLELMIIILFFAITSAVCVQLFVTAHLTDQHSSDLNRAVLEVQSAAECFKEGTTTQELCAMLGAKLNSDSTISVRYDKEWNRSLTGENCPYTLQITNQSLTDGMLSADVSMHKEDDLLFQVTVQRYMHDRRDAQ